jgi:hypothetical protein
LGVGLCNDASLQDLTPAVPIAVRKGMRLFDEGETPI